jgi:hypothetical protein
LTIRDGWHVNAHPASDPSLVATEVASATGRLRSLRYPEGEDLKAAFADTPLRVYAGRVVISGEVDTKGGAPPLLRLTYQACDESRCLAPVTREIPLP